MRWIIILWVLAAALPPALGQECSRVPLALQEDCNTIMTSDLTMEEKRETIGALLPGDSWAPAHEMALAWNRQVLQEYAGKPAPPGVASKSDGSLQEAWVKLLGLHPSVNDQGTLLHSGKGLALLVSGYRQVPYAGRLRGDCKTEYRPQPVQEVLTLLIDGVPQDYGQEIPYIYAGDGTFTARLDLSQTTYVDRYDSETYCCKQKTVCGWFCSTYCVEYCERCIFRGTETRQDQIVVEDSLEATLYAHEPRASLTPVEQYDETVRAIFQPDGDANTDLDVGDMEIRTQGVIYSTELDEESPQSLTAIAQHLSAPEDEALLLPANDECKLEVQDHFVKTAFPCSTTYTGSTLTLRTDKAFYREGEKIRLSIEPENLETEVAYAGLDFTTSGELTLEATPQQNRIRARAIGQERFITIGIVNPSPWRLLARITFFFLVIGVVFTSIAQWAQRRGLWVAR